MGCGKSSLYRATRMNHWLSNDTNILNGMDNDELIEDGGHNSTHEN